MHNVNFKCVLLHVKELNKTLHNYWIKHYVSLVFQSSVHVLYFCDMWASDFLHQIYILQLPSLPSSLSCSEPRRTFVNDCHSHDESSKICHDIGDNWFLVPSKKKKTDSHLAHRTVMINIVFMFVFTCPECVQFLSMRGNGKKEDKCFLVRGGDSCREKIL